MKKIYQCIWQNLHIFLKQKKGYSDMFVLWNAVESIYEKEIFKQQKFKYIRNPVWKKCQELQHKFFFNENKSIQKKHTL